MKSEEGLGIEYDENVICDVCRSPDSEEANEMVFCDSCNICVHQACYGITTIPSGKSHAHPKTLHRSVVLIHFDIPQSIRQAPGCAAPAQWANGPTAYSARTKAAP